LDRDLGKECFSDINCLLSNLKKMANIFAQQASEATKLLGSQTAETQNTEKAAVISNGKFSYMNL
jgi:hypothetical protein